MLPSRPPSNWSVLVVALVASACDRPFVPLDPPSIVVVSPDLSEVMTTGRAPFVLRVSSVRGVAEVTINGQPTTRVAGEDLFLDTLDIAEGLNTFIVEAEGTDGNVARDTLFALRLSLQSGVTPGGDLPEPRAHHAAAPLPNGSVLVSGGVGPDELVRPDQLLLRETTPFTFETTPAGALEVARAGHTASLLPDGRVLILGGASRAQPLTSDDFVTAVEIYDPSSGSSIVVPTRGDALRRSGHVTFLLQSAGRTYVYLVGGRGSLSGGVGTPSSVVIAELGGAAGADTLSTLTPAGGAGVLSPVTAPAGVALPVRDGSPRALVTGLYAPEALSVASRLVFLPGSSIYPFQVLEEFPEVPDDARDDAAAVRLDPTGDLVLLLGGRDAAGVVSARITAYADRAGAFFRVPIDRVALRVSRYGHTATLLPSGRIAVVGGYSVPGSPTAAAEVVYTD